MTMDSDQKKRALSAVDENMTVEANDDGTFTVKDKYQVDLAAKTCECPDHEYRGHDCKHLIRAQLEVFWENVQPVDSDDGTVTRPMPLQPKYENVPPVLAEMDQWVCWEYQRDSDPDHAKDWTKVPISIHGGFASSTDSDTWAPVAEVQDYDEATKDRTDGPGFVVSEDDDIVGIDIDDCRNPDTGELHPVVEGLIEKIGSYTEVSPSGTGLRTFVKGKWPDGMDNQTTIHARDGVDLEVYEWGRYLTFTGHHVEGTPEDVLDNPETIDLFADIMDPSYGLDDDE